MKLKQYIYLMRLNKPIGILLLLWPTLWALWLASHGNPNLVILAVFVAGVIIMRSAGCVINDFFDRNFDSHVSRTNSRPLATKTIPVHHAIILAMLLCLIAFTLVLFFCNLLTVQFAIFGVILAIIYPLLKRVTQLPQLGLGIAFSWGVPMAFAAVRNYVGTDGWFVFITAVIWPIIYDTMYAMVDRDEDMQIGIKSAAILFAQMDRLILGLLQILFIVMMIIIGLMFHLHLSFYVSLVIATLLFMYQQWLLSFNNTKNFYKAFKNNNWVGFCIFLGIVLSYAYPVHMDSIFRGINLEMDSHSDYEYVSDKISAVKNPQRDIQT